MTQAENIDLAYKLIESPFVETELPDFTIDLFPEHYDLVDSGVKGVITLRMSLPLAFGTTVIGDLPVEAKITKYQLVPTTDHTVHLKPIGIATVTVA